MKNRAFVRNLFLLLLSVSLIGGIAYLLIRSPRVTSTDRCEAVTIEVKTEAGGEPLFLTGDRITDELARRGIQLRGKRLDSIDLRKIERTLLSMPIYKRAEAFIAPSSSSVQIRLTEKHPLYIVQEASGKSYYVTQGKGTITVNPTFAAYLPIVSGAVDLKMATARLRPHGCLREDPYFTDYFGQSTSTRPMVLVLIPRIGTTRVIMGRESNWSEKLRKWRIFAESVLPQARDECLQLCQPRLRHADHRTQPLCPRGRDLRRRRRSRRCTSTSACTHYRSRSLPQACASSLCGSRSEEACRHGEAPREG